MGDLPDYAEALRKALGAVERRGAAETVGLERAAGRVLLREIVADRDQPPFHRAQMDGYAVRSAEVGRVEAFAVAGEIPAGAPPDLRVPPGHCAAISTGAPLPEGTDAVIPHERSDRGDPVRFSVTRIDAGAAVHPRGADARAGARLVAAGTVLGPHHVGLAAAAGLARLEVAARPRAVVLTSGDEVRPPEARVAPHEIRNANAAMLRPLLERAGAEPLDSRHLPDDRRRTVEAVGAALAECDLLVVVGGISAGRHDHFPAALEAHGVSLALRGAAIQPGRPILVGRPPQGAVVVGLPGNPVSALACTCLFIWPILRAMTGAPAPPWRTATLGAPVSPNPRRRAFRPARLGDGGAVAVPRWAGSGDLAHTAATDGLVELPVQAAEVTAGTLLRFLPWP